MNISMIFRNRNNLRTNLRKLNALNTLPKHRINNKNVKYIINVLENRLSNMTPEIVDTDLNENLYICSENRFVDINVSNNIYVSDELSSIIIDTYFHYQYHDIVTYDRQYQYIVCNINILTQFIYYILEREPIYELLTDFMIHITHWFYKDVIPYKNLLSYVFYLISSLPNNDKKKLLFDTLKLADEGKINIKDGETYYDTFDWIFNIYPM